MGSKPQTAAVHPRPGRPDTSDLEEILDPYEEVEHPLDPAQCAARVQASDFPGETFRVLKEKEIKQYGEYRTRRLVLAAWDLLSGER